MIIVQVRVMKASQSIHLKENMSSSTGFKDQRFKFKEIIFDSQNLKFIYSF